MGCGLSKCRKSKADRKASVAGMPTRAEMPADTSPLLSNNEKDAATADAEVEELDEADKELQRLADDRHDVNGSPPPTLNESRTSSVMSSERAGAPMPITAIATFKTLESPRSVVFTSSRPVSGVQSPATPPALAESPKATASGSASPPATSDNIEETKPVLTSPIVQTTEKTETGTDSTNNHLLTVEKVETETGPTSPIGSDNTTEDQAQEEHAATKIQAVYRGHRTRRSLNDGVNTAGAADVGAAVVTGAAAESAALISSPSNEKESEPDVLVSSSENLIASEEKPVTEADTSQESLEEVHEDVPDASEKRVSEKNEDMEPRTAHDDEVVEENGSNSTEIQQLKEESTVEETEAEKIEASSEISAESPNMSAKESINNETASVEEATHEKNNTKDNETQEILTGERLTSGTDTQEDLAAASQSSEVEEVSLKNVAAAPSEVFGMEEEFSRKNVDEQATLLETPTKEDALTREISGQSSAEDTSEVSVAEVEDSVRDTPDETEKEGLQEGSEGDEDHHSPTSSIEEVVEKKSVERTLLEDISLGASSAEDVEREEPANEVAFVRIESSTEREESGVAPSSVDRESAVEEEISESLVNEQTTNNDTNIEISREIPIEQKEESVDALSIATDVAPSETANKLESASSEHNAEEVARSEILTVNNVDEEVALEESNAEIRTPPDSIAEESLAEGSLKNNTLEESTGETTKSEILILDDVHEKVTVEEPNGEILTLGDSSRKGSVVEDVLEFVVREELAEQEAKLAERKRESRDEDRNLLSTSMEQSASEENACFEEKERNLVDREEKSREEGEEQNMLSTSVEESTVRDNISNKEKEVDSTGWEGIGTDSKVSTVQDVRELDSARESNDEKVNASGIFKEEESTMPEDIMDYVAMEVSDEQSSYAESVLRQESSVEGSDLNASIDYFAAGQAVLGESAESDQEESSHDQRVIPASISRPASMTAEDSVAPSSGKENAPQQTSREVPITREDSHGSESALSSIGTMDLKADMESESDRKPSAVEDAEEQEARKVSATLVDTIDSEDTSEISRQPSTGGDTVNSEVVLHVGEDVKGLTAEENVHHQEEDQTDAPVKLSREVSPVASESVTQSSNEENASELVPNEVSTTRKNILNSEDTSFVGENNSGSTDLGSGAERKSSDSEADPEEATKEESEVSSAGRNTNVEGGDLETKFIGVTGKSSSGEEIDAQLEVRELRSAVRDDTFGSEVSSLAPSDEGKGPAVEDSSRGESGEGETEGEKVSIFGKDGTKVFVPAHQESKQRTITASETDESNSYRSNTFDKENDPVVSREETATKPANESGATGEGTDGSEAVTSRRDSDEPALSDIVIQVTPAEEVDEVSAEQISAVEAAGKDDVSDDERSSPIDQNQLMPLAIKEVTAEQVSAVEAAAHDVDDAFDELFHDDGDHHHEDEEEIWNKLQKDMLEEEQRQEEEAVKCIQSSFRGYQTRKLLKQSDAIEGGKAFSNAPSQPNDAVVGEEDAAELDSPRNNAPSQPNDVVVGEEDAAELNSPPSSLTEARSAITDTQGAAAAAQPQLDVVPHQGTATKVRGKPQETAASDYTPPRGTRHRKQEDTTNECVSDLSVGTAEGGPRALLTADCGVMVTIEPCTESNDDHEPTLDDFVRSESHDGDWIDTSRSVSPIDEFGSDPAVVAAAAAATKIQAGYRGYRTRKQLKRKRCVPSAALVDESECSNTPNCVVLDGFSPSQFATLHESQVQNAAATKIQAGFRGFRVRRDLSRLGRCNGPRGRWTRLQNVRHNSLPLEGAPSASSDQDRAATKIQAGVRGFLVRRRQQRLRGGETSTAPAAVVLPSFVSKHRAVQSRRSSSPDVKKLMGQSSGESLLEQALMRSAATATLQRRQAADSDRAAVLIQAAYRGYRVRQQIKADQGCTGRSDEVSTGVTDSTEAAATASFSRSGKRSRKKNKNQRKNR